MANLVEPITAQGAYSITKSDTTVYTRQFSALYVGGGGDVALRTSQGDSVTFVGVTAGAILPIRGDKVLSTGTTATDILGLTY